MEVIQKGKKYLLFQKEEKETVCDSGKGKDLKGKLESSCSWRYR